MRMPAWVLVMVGVPLAAAGVWCFAVADGAPGVVASLVLLVSGAWVLSGLARPKPQGVASVSVAEPVKIGGEARVTVRLHLPKKLALNVHRQQVRFIIEESVTTTDLDDTGDHRLHEAVLPLNVPPDTLGDWQTTLSLKVPESAPPTMRGGFFEVRARVELSLPHGSFGELTASAPVVILPEVAGG